MLKLWYFDVSLSTMRKKITSSLTVIIIYIQFNQVCYEFSFKNIIYSFVIYLLKLIIEKHFILCHMKYVIKSPLRHKKVLNNN